MATNKAYAGTPEVTPQGVVKRGTKPRSKAGEVRVTYRRESRAKSWLRTYIGAVIFTDAMAGMVMIYNLGLDPAMQAHAMWAFGIAHGVAMVSALFVKLE